MKKYTQPTVEISTFEIEDVIMASGVTPPSTSLGANGGADKDAGKAALESAGYVVVEW